MKVDARIKSHLIQLVRKHAKRARWFGPVLFIEVTGSEMGKIRPMLCAVWDRVRVCHETDYETCGDEHCCGWTQVWSADFRTGCERIQDRVLGFTYGPKGWKL